MARHVGRIAGRLTTRSVAGQTRSGPVEPGAQDSRCVRGAHGDDRLATTRRPRSTRSNAFRGRNGIPSSNRLLRSSRTGRISPASGDVWNEGNAGGTEWTRRSHPQSPLAGPATSTSDPRPRRLLANVVLRCAEGNASQVSQTFVARRSPHGTTNPTNPPQGVTWSPRALCTRCFVLHLYQS